VFAVGPRHRVFREVWARSYRNLAGKRDLQAGPGRIDRQQERVRTRAAEQWELGNLCTRVLVFEYFASMGLPQAPRFRAALVASGPAAAGVSSGASCLTRLIEFFVFLAHWVRSPPQPCVVSAVEGVAYPTT